MVGGEISQPRDFFHCHRYRIEEIAAENETYNGTHVIPFKKVTKNTYKSPSGRTFTKKQVKLYHATDGFKKKPTKKKPWTCIVVNTSQFTSSPKINKPITAERV